MKRSIKIFLVLSALSLVATLLPKYIERHKYLQKSKSVRSEHNLEAKRNHQKPLMGGVKMSALIEGFKKEHFEILEALNEVKELGVLSKEGQTKLMSIKATLLKHFKEEDEQFYPVLWKEAEQNMKLKEELEVFEKDLENASRFVFEFFDKCNKGLPGANLSSDFETLFMVIRDRMRNEENILYDEYDKLY
jgi:hypothetical protein